MAPRTRSTRSAAARGARPKTTQRQSSLTFGNSRVTKPTNTLSAKDKIAADDAEAKAAKLLQHVEEDSKTQDQAKEVRLVKAEDDDSKAVEEEEEEEDDEEKELITKMPIRTQAQPQAPSGPEAVAKKISETQIRKYWKAKEDERKTPRYTVHQEGLSLHEKVLREFDMSYQYGPCIGITRAKRWKRAENLGLQPPIEVLAVLLKEEEKNNGSQAKDKMFERAYMDTLANSRLVAAT